MNDLLKRVSTNRTSKSYESQCRENKRANLNFLLKYCVPGVHSTIMYKNANENIEWISELFANLVFAVAIIVVFLPLLYTAINYCVLESGAESFILFFPAWFVLLKK